MCQFATWRAKGRRHVVARRDRWRGLVRSYNFYRRLSQLAAFLIDHCDVSPVDGRWLAPQHHSPSQLFEAATGVAKVRSAHLKTYLDELAKPIQFKKGGSVFCFCLLILFCFTEEYSH